MNCIYNLIGFLLTIHWGTDRKMTSPSFYRLKLWHIDSMLRRVFLSLICQRCTVLVKNRVESDSHYLDLVKFRFISLFLFHCFCYLYFICLALFYLAVYFFYLTILTKIQDLTNYLRNFTSFILDGKLYRFLDKDLVCIFALTLRHW